MVSLFDSDVKFLPLNNIDLYDDEQTSINENATLLHKLDFSNENWIRKRFQPESIVYFRF